MGSQTILDLIASTMVFGTLLMIALRLNGGTMENMQSFREDILVQQNLVAVTVLLEYDFRKIGYC
jgi:type II secretory pathway component PulJ